MLIVIEGPDGAGKSTLARMLADELPEDQTEVRHCGPLKQHPLVEYERDLDDYVPGDGRHVIYDRHYMGELIYGPLYRDRSQLTDEALVHVEMYLNSRGAVLVHMTHDVSTLKARCRANHEDFLLEDDIEHVKRSYHRQMVSSMLACRVDVTDPRQYDVERLLMLAESQTDAAQPIAKYPGYVGPRQPEVLLLGERRGPSNPGHVASFVPYPHTSGAYLLGVLRPNFRRRVGIANALEEDVLGLWLALDEPKIVTLGAKAHTVCDEAGIKHSALPHPQYVRRFHHARRQEYGEVIEQAGRTEVEWTSWP